MKIGITGTRSGMNELQMKCFKDLLESYNTLFCLTDENHEFHHGDCIGVDVEGAIIAAGLGLKTVNHPPIKEDLRAFHKSDETREPLTYFARNRNIVDETDLLIVVPYQNEHMENGGTWYTHDYALKKKKSRVILFPDGRVIEG